MIECEQGWFLPYVQFLIQHEPTTILLGSSSPKLHQRPPSDFASANLVSKTAGAIYLCSYWYMPKNLATRISYFYCASALSGAFSGLLAAGIAKMDGTGGYSGWRWIFIRINAPTPLSYP